MDEAKLIIIFPNPTDEDLFEKFYQQEPLTKVNEEFAEKTKIVTTKVLTSPQGRVPFYRITEIYFPSIDALKTCIASKDVKKILDHAVFISLGGRPAFLIAEEKSFTFNQS